MSDDEVTYEFVKGEGWVPKKKSPWVRYDMSKILVDWQRDYLKFALPPVEDDYVLHRGAGVEIYRGRRPRRDLTLEQFEGRLHRDRVSEWETRLYYTTHDGQTLAFVVESYYGEANPELQFDRRMNWAIRAMYQEAQRRGF